jgi:DNA-binding protein
MSNDVVYVGRKPILNYCQAIIQSLQDNDTVKLQARGSSISRAVDSVEITRNRYLNGIMVKSIQIGTDELRSEDGDIRNVSSITIILEKEQ